MSIKLIWIHFGYEMKMWIFSLTISEQRKNIWSFKNISAFVIGTSAIIQGEFWKALKLSR